jgi:hypothetical protein
MNITFTPHPVFPISTRENNNIVTSSFEVFNHFHAGKFIPASMVRRIEIGND